MTADVVMFSLVLREFVSCVKAIRQNDAEIAFGKHTLLYDMARGLEINELFKII